MLSQLAAKGSNSMCIKTPAHLYAQERRQTTLNNHILQSCNVTIREATS